MKRKLMLFTAIMASAATAQARQLSPAESLQRFAECQPALHKAQGIVASEMQLGYTSTIADGNAFYVFEYPQREGFIILGADDLVPEVLAYSEEGRFDPSNLPEGLAYWMQDLNRQIALAVKAGVPLYSSTAHSAQRASVAPILTCVWGQGDEYSPYYNDCPTHKGEPCVAGCVATAMAQVMYAHKYPSRGQGSLSYTTATLGIAQSANFNTTYAWNSMLDAYGYSYKDNGAEGYDHHEYTYTQGAAVAKLMHHCGVSVYMDYNVASTGGSGTLSHYVMPALYKYFKYDASGLFRQRDYCTDEQWEGIIYSEIADGRPVFYSGATSTSGHAFVVDGYRNGYYHVNWGWENMCNGYYAITGTDPLHPTHQGTGGSVTDEGFRYQQSCISGLRPAVAGSRVIPNFYLDGREYNVLDTGQNTVERLDAGEYGILNVPDGMIYSVSNEKLDVCLSVKFVNSETQTVHYAVVYDEESDEIDILNGLRGYYFRTEEVPDGLYRVYPVVRIKGREEWTDIALPIGMDAPQIILGDYAPVPTRANAELACSSFTLNKADTRGRSVSANVTDVLNVSSDNSAFWGDIAIGIYNKNDDLVGVLSEGKHTVTEQNPLNHYKYFTNPITLTGNVPTGLEDGEYVLSPVAFQKDSEKWTCLGTFDVESKMYNMKQFQDIAMSVRNGKVQIEGADPDPADSYALYISDEVAADGSTLTLPIRLQNAEPICGLQFDIALQSGVSYRKNGSREDITLSPLRTTATKTDVFDFEKQSSGDMRVVACSTAGTAFAGKNGDVVVLRLNVSSTRLKSGFTVNLRNIVLTDSKATAYKLPDYERKVVARTVDGIDTAPAGNPVSPEVYLLNGTRSHQRRHGEVSIIRNAKEVRKTITE